MSNSASPPAEPGVYLIANYDTVFRGERIEMRKDYGLIFFDVSNIFNMKEMTNVNRAGMPHLRCRYSSGRR